MELHHCRFMDTNASFAQEVQSFLAKSVAKNTLSTTFAAKAAFSAQHMQNTGTLFTSYNLYKCPDECFSSSVNFTLSS
jgi:hypothetical protein